MTRRMSTQLHCQKGCSDRYVFEQSSRCNFPQSLNAVTRTCCCPSSHPCLHSSRAERWLQDNLLPPIQRDKCKTEKRNQLQAKFEGDMAGMEQNIDELFERAAGQSYVSNSFLEDQRQRHDILRPIADVSCSTVLRLSFTTRLMELFKKRGDIEAQIISHSRILEHAYSAANNELRTILKGKMEDIESGPKTLKKLHSEDAHSA